MILKISVHDNDFGLTLEKFCGKIAAGWCSLKDPEPAPEDRDGMCEWYYRLTKDKRFFREALKKYGTEISEDDKKRVIQIVTDSFAHFTGDMSSEDAKYLQGAFDCEIVHSVVDEWANGEDYYVFPGSYVGKVLCF